jgi:hypothetical protein
MTLSKKLAAVLVHRCLFLGANRRAVVAIWGTRRFDPQNDSLSNYESQSNSESGESTGKPARLQLMQDVHVFGDGDPGGENLSDDRVGRAIKEVGLVELVKSIAAEPFVATGTKRATGAKRCGGCGDQGGDKEDAGERCAAIVENAGFVGEGKQQGHQRDDGEDDPPRRALLGALALVALSDLRFEEIIGETDVSLAITGGYIVGHFADARDRSGGILSDIATISIWETADNRTKLLACSPTR